MPVGIESFEEVLEGFAYVDIGRVDKVAEMTAWYDGYRFGNVEVYNPWSVLNHLSSGEAQTTELAVLASGGTVAKPLDLRTVFDDLSENPEAVWAQLYQAGYVTTRDTGRPNDDAMPRELYIPNLEVKQLYQKELLVRGKRVVVACRRADA